MASHGAEASLMRAIFVAFGARFMWIGRILILGMMCHMAQPQLLGALVGLLQDEGATPIAWCYAALLPSPASGTEDSPS